MVTVNLKGGLGNQLFQYALGRNLSLKLNTHLRLDVSNFEKDKLRSFRLNSFCLPNQVSIVKRNLFQNLLYKFFLKYQWIQILFPTNRIILEKSFAFEPKILQCRQYSFLDGFWQSEKYFSEIADILKSDLTLKNSISLNRKALREKILSTNSVSIHVRRGDYASNPVTTAFHGLCSTEWYLNAAKILGAEISNPHFYIFSDDIEWVTNNIKLQYEFTIIQPSEDGKEAEDLILMSECKHNIISNSSFSWWAAWLNKNPNKIVIAPVKWFANDDINTNDLIPANWLRI